MDSWPALRVPELPGQAPEVLVWDTASGSLAQAANGQVATIYACGITPYDATHIGHAATYIAWDLLVRGWLDSGHEVRYVQNVTDVDDPLLERAERDGEDWRSLADREIELYRVDMTALQVLPPAHLIGAVEALDVIEEFNGTLAGRDALYDLDGDVYFRRTDDRDFGSVSGYDEQTMVELFAERGGDPARAGKKDPLDPLVWLARRPGEPSWDSRFGAGRPGWHVECAAIATKYLGRTFDVQAGGSDLIFPHHEMSASHARVAFGATDDAVFARRYAHAGMVRLGGEKMSKSLGNLVFVSRLRESGIDPMAVRLAILAHHYRQDWDWTDAGLEAARARLGRWRAAVAAWLDGPVAQLAGHRVAGPLGAAGTAAGPGPGEPDAALEVLQAIRERLADDLDAPGAIHAVDAWADAVLASSAPAKDAGGAGVGGAAGSGEGWGNGAARAGASAGLVRDAIAARLGVTL